MRKSRFTEEQCGEDPPFHRVPNAPLRRPAEKTSISSPVDGGEVSRALWRVRSSTAELESHRVTLARPISRYLRSKPFAAWP